MEIKKSHRFLLAFAALFILISLIQESYAKYLTNVDANTNITIARWSILINNHNVMNDSNFTNAIQPIFPGNNYIAENIIAPTAEGYFDLVIDFSRVDVAFNKTISIAHAPDNTISDMIITGYSLNGETIIPVNSSNLQFTNNILLNTPLRVNSYRIFVKWLDGPGETMDNEADTEATRNGRARFRVDASFVQIPQ